MEYMNVGDHAEILDDGRPVGVGEIVELTKDQVREPVAEDRIAAGALLAVDDEAEKEGKLAERRTKTKVDSGQTDDEEEGGKS